MSTAANIITIETQIIGAVLGHDALFPRASCLHHDAFSDPSNATIWRLLSEVRLSGRTPTPALLAMSYPAEIEPLGGIPYLNRLTEMGEVIVTGFGEAVDRLYEEFQWRRIAAISARLQTALSSRDKTPEQVLSGLLDFSRKALERGHTAFQTKREVAAASLVKAQETRETTTTGIDTLDYMMGGGVQTKRLYGIGGPFGRGKTIMLGSISDNINLQNIPHLFFSLETPPEDIEIRSCARRLNINASAIHDQGDPDHARFVASTSTYISKIPDNTIYEYSPAATIDEIHRKILAAKARFGIKGFIIDYWQLIRGRERGQTEDAHLRDVADRLAAICRQEDLWGIVTAQVDERGRLRVSEALLQSASLYLRLVREENDMGAFFVTEKSNYTRYLDTGNESVPGMIFDDMVGPHFRNTQAEDMGDLAKAQEDDIKL